MFGTGRVKKVFSPRIFTISKEMVTNMKLAFTNVPFRHNSACVIQKWLWLKKVITVRLAYISYIFPNGSKIIQLMFSSLAYL